MCKDNQNPPTNEKTKLHTTEELAKQEGENSVKNLVEPMLIFADLLHANHENKERYYTDIDMDGVARTIRLLALGAYTELRLQARFPFSIDNPDVVHLEEAMSTWVREE